MMLMDWLSTMDEKRPSQYQVQSFFQSAVVPGKVFHCTSIQALAASKMEGAVEFADWARPDALRVLLPTCSCSLQDFRSQWG
jgi:hypothetical protein